MDGKKGKKIHVFRWILIGNMKPMLREGNELQRGSVKGITGAQPVNGNEIYRCSSSVMVDVARRMREMEFDLSLSSLSLFFSSFVASIFRFSKDWKLLRERWIGVELSMDRILY